MEPGTTEARAKRAAYMRDYNARNRERRREVARAEYRRNRQGYLARASRRKAEKPEVVKAEQRAYYEANKDRILARNKDWKDANPEQYRKAKRAWEKRNPEYMAEKARARRATRELRGEIPRNIRAILLAEQGGRCVYCRADVTEVSHIDHIMPIKRGGAHRRANLQLLCPTCNHRKKDKHPADFESEIGFVR